MLRLALVFLLIAIVAGMFGFPLLSAVTYDFAKILFFVFIVLAVLALLGGVLRGPAV